MLCIPWLRWKHPEWERPIKVNMIWPVLYILATIFITVVPMIAKPFETGMGCVIILTAIPVYFTLVKWKSKPAFIRRNLSKSNCLTDKEQGLDKHTLFFLDASTIFFQKILMVVAPAKKVD